MNIEELKNILEALLFVSQKPLTFSDIRRVFEKIDLKDVRVVVEQLNHEYKQGGRVFSICEVAGGYQLITNPLYGQWIKRLFKKKSVAKLSSPALETLAIIAYKQPITKFEIEAIRGVNVDGVLNTLMDRKLVKISGRKETIGRPLLYSTTEDFMVRFGLKDLNDLPKLEEFAKHGLNELKDVD